MKFTNKLTGSNKPNLVDKIMLFIGHVLIVSAFNHKWSDWKRAVVTLEKGEYVIEFEKEEPIAAGAK